MWNSIEQELTRIGRIVKGWESGEISELERDMVLKKLSVIYEQVKFGEGPSLSKAKSLLEVEGDDQVDTLRKDVPLQEEVLLETEAPKEVDVQFEEEIPQRDVELEDVARLRRDRSIIDSLYGAPAMQLQQTQQETVDEELSGQVESIEEETFFVEETQVEQTVEQEAPAEYEQEGVIEIPDNIFDDMDEPLEVIEEEPEAVTIETVEMEIARAVEEDSDVEKEIEQTEIMSKEERKSLGEVLHTHERTLADAYAENGKKHDMASKLSSTKVSGLRKAIGINDKFLMIKELFGGDSVAFDVAISKLEEFTDLDDALIYIHETYSWNPNSEAVKLLMELLTRKLS